MHLKSLNNCFVFILFLFLIQPGISFSQIPVEAIEETSKKEQIKYIHLLCYSDLLQYSTYISPENYFGLIDNSEKIFNIDTLLSEGFKENIIFFKVTFKEGDSLDLLYDELEKNGNLVRKIQTFRGAEYFLYPQLLNHSYIFASTPNGLYKLKGFRISDFRSFYSTCYNAGNCFSGQEIEDLKKKDKRIIKLLSVESLNLWEMYKMNY